MYLDASSAKSIKTQKSSTVVKLMKNSIADFACQLIKVMMIQFLPKSVVKYKRK